MNKAVLVSIAAFALTASVAPAAPAVDEQVLAPIESGYQYIVSPRGVHLAAVVRKGIRLQVKVDGSDGPRVDAVEAVSTGWVDPRPYQVSGPAIGGRYRIDQPGLSQPVIFSTDGAHSAYLARVGSDWVLYRDQQEILRMPAGGLVGGTVGVGAIAGSTDIRLQFSGAHGEHLLFARSSGLNGGYELWVDAQKWPGSFTSTGSGLDTTDPIISPDGEHVAYPAQLDSDHRALVVDGKAADFYAEKLTYSSDSKHLFGEAPGSNGGTSLMEDGKRLFTARGLIKYFCAPVTNRVAAVLNHQYPDGSNGQFMVVDGKPVPATLCHDGIPIVHFSPDGQHYAAVCKEGQNYYVVSDGNKGEPYDALGTGQPNIATIPSDGISFSPDSSRLLYLEHGGGKYILVVNGDESDQAFDSLQGFLFSGDGRRYAAFGGNMGSNAVTLILDGKVLRSAVGISLAQFAFSPDGSRYAFVQAGGNDAGFFVDGNRWPVNVKDFWFSPDGQHVAATGYRPSDGVSGLFLDGNPVYKGGNWPSSVAFSADSRHLYWCVQESDPTRTNGNYYVLVTYVDGQPAARSDCSSWVVLTKPGGYADYTVHPGWQTVGESGLTCLISTTSGEIHRCAITPAGTNLDSLLAMTKTAPIHP